MTVSLQLGRYLYNCPRNWHRFIKDLETCLNHNDIEGFSVDQLNQELARFKAQYIEGDNSSSRVDFADERCYTMFILKYGGE